jgi:hypothetical protein
MSFWRFAPRAAVSLTLLTLWAASGCGRSDLDPEDLFPDSGFGDAPSVGGTPSNGGAIGVGGNTGGRIATGGRNGVGGLPGTGGRFPTGGATGFGGLPTGGVTGFGGFHTGGVTGFGGFHTGGVIGVGGFVTGGRPNTGGIIGVGGFVTGGAGGGPSGGAGGVHTGGAGGTTAGGAGGTATGGVHTGGSGGTATGGASTGGVDGGADCASTCAGCCDALDRCHDGTAANACGASGVKCIDCGSSGFGCVNGSCRGTPPKCGPATCAGCCDGLGRCRSGEETDACGSGGGTCSACAPPLGGCSAGKCSGPPPPCGPDNCGGCCTAAGACVTGTADAACGATGASCQNCSANGRKCNQPGSYCTFVPSCSATTCPDGCCDASGVCRNGRADAACGASGQKCIDCGANANAPHCAAAGFCYAGAHCGPDNCGGCCTANGQCVNGQNNARCGLYGDLCDNCSTKNQTCQNSACGNPGATCPAPYAGCNPGVLTPPPTPTQNCSDADLASVVQACKGTPPGQTSQACQNGLAALLRSSPGCFDCLQQFTNTGGVASCLAPFINSSCNHDLTCSLACGDAACGSCPAGDQSTCRNGAFTASGTCSSYVNGTFCASAAFGGPGAFCDVERIGDVGVWLQGVGAYYCSN